jgi:7-cyano-7-deazaguanine synthase
VHLAKSWHEELGLLFFDFEQESTDRELSCARILANDLELPLQIIKAPVQLPDAGFTDRSYAFGIAAEYAAYRGYGRVCCGLIANDISLRPQIAKFIEAFSQSMEYMYGNGGPERTIEITAPLLGKNKRDVILLGASLGVNFAQTWSCRSPGPQPCQQCPRCQERAQGFFDAKLTDPIL